MTQDLFYLLLLFLIVFHSFYNNNTYFTLNSQETNTCVWFVGPGCRPALSIRLQSILSTNKYAYSYVYAHIKYIHTKHTQWKKWAGSQTPASKETWQCLIFWIQCMSYVVFIIWDNLIICYVWSLIKHNKWLNKRGDNYQKFIKRKCLTYNMPIYTLCLSVYAY